VPAYLQTLRPLESVAVLGHPVVFREACSIGRLRFLHPSIDILYLLFHVEFENELPISVWKNRAAHH
jgi:hypothetical protein